MKALPCPGLMPTGLFFFFLYKIAPNQNKIHIHTTPHTRVHTHTVIFSVTIKKNPSANIKLCKPGPMRI